MKELIEALEKVKKADDKIHRIEGLIDAAVHRGQLQVNANGNWLHYPDLNSKLGTEIKDALDAERARLIEEIKPIKEKLSLISTLIEK